MTAWFVSPILEPVSKILQPALRAILPEREARRGDSSQSYGPEEATTRSGGMIATLRDQAGCRNAFVAAGGVVPTGTPSPLRLGLAATSQDRERSIFEIGSRFIFMDCPEP